MKYILFFILVSLHSSCMAVNIPTHTVSLNEMSNDDGGNYTLIVEGYDWGPGANKVILNTGNTINSVNKDDYEVTAKKQAECGGTKSDASTGERKILYAYVSDEKGNKASEGNHITLVLLVAPNLGISSPMQYMPQCRGNVWADYSIKVLEKTTGQSWNKEANRIHPLVDEFDLTGQFTFNSEVTLSYADFTPKTEQESIPLIIWLHGGGEGGTDPSIPLMANRAANYASVEMQSYFGGAYVLVPQAPTFWMDNGMGGVQSWGF